jgi:hypothetical protein
VLKQKVVRFTGDNKRSEWISKPRLLRWYAGHFAI